jgi:hypothetical protein
MAHCLGVVLPDEVCLRQRLTRYLAPGRLAGDGYTDGEIARLVNGEFGLHPRLRCLAPYDAVLFDVPPSWVHEGSDKELKDWLRMMGQAHRPVKVSLDMGRLENPLKPASGRNHSVVVLEIADKVVRYFEPDPLTQTAYPKRGVIDTAPYEHFVAAWRELFFIAFSFEK